MFDSILRWHWGLISVFLIMHPEGGRAAEPARDTNAPAAVRPENLQRFEASNDPRRATVRIRADQRASDRIPKELTGKFAEHLGANIYQGMDAQVLHNPTMADYPFWTGQMSPDGVTLFHWEAGKINDELRRQARRAGWPETESENLVQARTDGLACWWSRVGSRTSVQPSPDTGQYGGRTQRLELRQAGVGLGQWTYLPLHRLRTYEFEILARSPDITSLIVSLSTPESKLPPAHVTVNGLSRRWQKLKGRLQLPEGSPSDRAYRLAILAPTPGQVVIGYVLLRPSDHVQGADPDIVRLLKSARLPILRWPGGNFVSGYHWEDGIGPIEQRPTRPNFAWGGVEPNLFGTDEFMAFCHAVGCTPMICLNAGSGTPAEAARWMEYCDGDVKSPMGARRAANGHPEAYRVAHWEIGNELWGRWQYNWTSAAGYVDRYQEFLPALLAVEPGVAYYACGAPVFWGKEWNDTLIRGAGPLLSATTDHPLIGGDVDPAVAPLDVFRDFMAVPGVLEQKWSRLRDDMSRGGVSQPRLAVTELQLFAHLRAGTSSTGAPPARLTPATLVNPGTQAEALYDVLIYHAAVRLAPFIPMVTHSAVVNHGGGLRKERERVYANPCYYAQAAFADLAGATPVVTEVTAATERAPLVLPDLKKATSEATFGVIDTLGAEARDGSLLLSLVHRGTTGPVQLTVEFDRFVPAATAEVWTLAAEVPWAANSLAAPEAVAPKKAEVRLDHGQLKLELPPFAVLRVRVAPGI